MYNASHYVWLWLDPVSNAPRFVGSGNGRFGIKPWDKLWDDRGGSSPVSQWLATIEKPPLRDPTVSEIPYFRYDAMQYAAKVRKGINAELLSNRSYEGTQRGGGKAQAVIDPDGDLFVSVRAAARDKGLDVGTICHYLKHSAQTGWRYANADQQAKRQAPNSCCSLCHKHGNKRELIEGPEWSPSAICKKCQRVIQRLEKQGEFQPELMRLEAYAMRIENFDHLSEGTAANKRRRYRKSQESGLPKWLEFVASLIETKVQQ